MNTASAGIHHNFATTTVEESTGVFISVSFPATMHNVVKVYYLLTIPEIKFQCFPTEVTVFALFGNNFPLGINGLGSSPILGVQYSIHILSDTP